jgi:Fe-S-cluster-containing hydrogenase component 2
MTTLPRSGVVQVDASLCLACRECEVACSLAHERACNPHLARLRIVFDDFAPGLPAIELCKQCDWPACYYACLSKWGEAAIVVDAQSGARVIATDKCRGCGSCLRACPLTPEHPVIQFKTVGRKRIYIKCDLCAGRPQGPACVQVCPGGALTLVTAEARR